MANNKGDRPPGGKRDGGMGFVKRDTRSGEYVKKQLPGTAGKEPSGHQRVDPIYTQPSAPPRPPKKRPG
jgi:hypothetical protein